MRESSRWWNLLRQHWSFSGSTHQIKEACHYWIWQLCSPLPSFTRRLWNQAKATGELTDGSLHFPWHRNVTGIARQVGAHVRPWPESASMIGNSITQSEGLKVREWSMNGGWRCRNSGLDKKSSPTATLTCLQGLWKRQVNTLWPGEPRQNNIIQFDGR